MSFIEELRWRGMLKDMTQGTEEYLAENKVTGYVGFDPTAKSLTVGNLVPVMLLAQLQRAGCKPIALVGGATGMIGDPSGKDEERKLPDEKVIRENEQLIEKQLRKLLDFDSKENPVVLLNNYDWFKEMSTLTFLRDIGKYLTVSYLLSKGFIKERLNKEISFTEFNYILIQSYDFYWLMENENCVLQLGGSDQWGNITSGIELIRKKERKTGYGITCPLMTKADGTKFGKTEEGNIWLDPEMTTPYKFYQFWLNSSDEDASKFIRIFTFLSKEEIESIEKEHNEAPHQRTLQKTLAKEVTIYVHSEEELDKAIKASNILFGKATKDELRSLSESVLLDIFEGVPQMKMSKEKLQTKMSVLDMLSEETDIFPSKGEARRTLQGGGLSINKQKIDDLEMQVSMDDLLNDKYILVQKGKKNYYLVIVN